MKETQRKQEKTAFTIFQNKEPSPEVCHQTVIRMIAIKKYTVYCIVFKVSGHAV